MDVVCSGCKSELEIENDVAAGDIFVCPVCGDDVEVPARPLPVSGDKVISLAPPPVNVAPPPPKSPVPVMAPPPVNMAPPPVNMAPPPVNVVPPPPPKSSVPVMAPPPVNVVPPPKSPVPVMAPPPVNVIPPPLPKSPVPVMAPPPEEFPVETIPFICAYCDTYAEIDASLEGKEYECQACAEVSIAVKATDRQCPFCSERVKIRAQICRFCHKPLPMMRPGVPLSQPAFVPNTASPEQNMFKQMFEKLKFWKK